MVGLDGIENQVPVQTITGAYSFSTTFWSVHYTDVALASRDSDPDYQYVLLQKVSAVAHPNDLCSVLGVTLGSITQYLDELVVQGHNPPGESLINRWWYKIEVDGTEWYCTPRAYLYQVATALGSTAPV